jgi:hypothetical protein
LALLKKKKEGCGEHGAKVHLVGLKKAEWQAR